MRRHPACEISQRLATDLRGFQQLCRLIRGGEDSAGSNPATWPIKSATIPEQ
jgi:hypothetical protein